MYVAPLIQALAIYLGKDSFIVISAIFVPTFENCLNEWQLHVWFPSIDLFIENSTSAEQKINLAAVITPVVISVLVLAVVVAVSILKIRSRRAVKKAKHKAGHDNMGKLSLNGRTTQKSLCFLWKVNRSRLQTCQFWQTVISKESGSERPVTWKVSLFA